MKKELPDIRWKQRLNSFVSAYEQLKSAVELSQKRDLSDLEKQGVIQAFEFTHELAWKLIKDYFDFQGASQISGSRDATKEAFAAGLIKDGQGWMEMLQSRNQTSHTYNKKVANEIVDKVIKDYSGLFAAFYVQMAELSKK